MGCPHKMSVELIQNMCFVRVIDGWADPVISEVANKTGFTILTKLQSLFKTESPE